MRNEEAYNKRHEAWMIADKLKQYGLSSTVHTEGDITTRTFSVIDGPIYAIAQQSPDDFTLKINPEFNPRLTNTVAQDYPESVPAWRRGTEAPEHLYERFFHEPLMQATIGGPWKLDTDISTWAKGQKFRLPFLDLRNLELYGFTAHAKLVTGSENSIQVNPKQDRIWKAAVEQKVAEPRLLGVAKITLTYDVHRQGKDDEIFARTFGLFIIRGKHATHHHIPDARVYDLAETTKILVTPISEYKKQDVSERELSILIARILEAYALQRPYPG